jgi:hypothetical protein
MNASRPLLWWTIARTRPRVRALLVVAALVSCFVAMPALADEDPWPCQVVLCLANPDGPTALKECRPPIERAWRTWARGKRVPDCKKKNQDGSSGAPVREDGTYIEQMPSNPYQEGQCPFVYYAGYDQRKYCAFAGVTNEYIDGRLWGRIWYGGPGGVPYIEQLYEDPMRPRPADGFEEAWRVLKGSIENKSDLAALAHKIWQDADKRATAAETLAAAERRKADNEARVLAWIEANAPAALAAAAKQQAAASAAYSAAAAAAEAAKAAAQSPTATPAEKARYDALVASERAAWSELSWAAQAVDQANGWIASIPSRRASVDQLEQKARAAETSAADRRSEAIVANVEFDAAELAARPLPAYGY